MAGNFRKEEEKEKSWNKYNECGLYRINIIYLPYISKIFAVPYTFEYNLLQ